MTYTVVIANENMPYVALNDELLVFYPSEFEADKTANLLNQETAPLLARIAELEAALDEMAQSMMTSAMDDTKSYIGLCAELERFAKQAIAIRKGKTE